MWLACKKLSLGLSAIALASLVLLLTDGGLRSQSAAAKKVWQIRILEYVNIPDSEEAEHGVRDGLREAGLVEGQDYAIQVANAQGDIATLNGIIDAAVTDQADLIVTLSTPTLQAALQRVKKQPVVFTFVSNPFAAGAGPSDAEHQPNFTGSYGSGDVVGMAKVIRQVLPQARRVGTLFVPNEVNSVFNHDQFIIAAKEVGLEVSPLGVSTPAEVADTALALCSQPIDLVCLPPANLTASSFPSIVQASRRAKLPVFAFMGSALKPGAMVVLARDYYDMGHSGGGLAAKVIRGADPAKLPFEPLTESHLMLNLAAARHCGIDIPAATRKAAEKVVEE